MSFLDLNCTTHKKQTLPKKMEAGSLASCDVFRLVLRPTSLLFCENVPKSAEIGFITIWYLMSSIKVCFFFELSSSHLVVQRDRNRQLRTKLFAQFVFLPESIFVTYLATVYVLCGGI